MDSILDIDTILQDDSFILLAEDEAINNATHILKQWRMMNMTSGEEPHSIVGPMPPAAPLHHNPLNRASLLVDTRTFTRSKKRPNLNETISFSGQENQNGNHGGVNLKVGGLVTSTNHMAPQRSFALTTSMQKSLIGDTSPPASIGSNSLEMSAAPNERLINQSLITSNDFAHETYFLDNNNTLQASVNNGGGYKMEDVAKDRDALMQMTFDAANENTVVVENHHPVENKSFGQPNGTFDLGNSVNRGKIEERNSTFDLGKDMSELGVSVEEDEIHLQFDNDQDSFIQSTPICKTKPKQDVFDFSPTNNEDMYRTMELNFKNSRPNLEIPEPEKNEREVLVDEKSLLNLMSTTVDVIPAARDEEEEDDLVVDLRPKANVPLEMLRPEERQSLTNFEEYEKSLMLLEDNKNEHEFDNMLNSLNNLEMRRSNEKMRQSLDSIKKRHSLINYEKQQEELRKRVNNIDIEINNLTMDSSGGSSSGGGSRLLNRRSRLFDEVQANDATTVLDKTTDLNANSEENLEPQEKYEKKNRDRFKTIKITRKSLNCNIPDADATSVELNTLQRTEEVQEPVQVPVRPPARTLTRPRFTSGLMRPSQLNINAQKSSSADDLLDNPRTEQYAAEKNRIPDKIKSPMGIKAKSIHNLAGNYMTQNQPKYGRFQVPEKPSQNTYKLTRPSYGGSNNQINKPVQSVKPLSGNVNSRPTKSLGGMQRPASTATNFQVQSRIHEPEFDSGRYSPTNYSVGSSAASIEPKAKLEPRIVGRPSGLRPPGSFARPAGKSGLPRLSSIPRR